VAKQWQKKKKKQECVQEEEWIQMRKQEPCSHSPKKPLRIIPEKN